MSQPERFVRRFQRVSSLAVVAGIVWVTFVAASLAPFLLAQSTGYRPVHVNNTYVGNVELYNLVGGTGLNVIFHPVNNDLNIINIYRLNWWQVWNRPNNATPPFNMNTSPPRPVSGSHGIDPPNGGYTYQDNGADNDPSYYTNNQRSNNGQDGWNSGSVFANNNWWMQDWPSGLNGFDAETWLVTSENGNVKRLVCLNWSIVSNGGTVNANLTRHPNFINSSAFNTNQMLNNSGFNVRDWRVSNAAVTSEKNASVQNAGAPPGSWAYSVQFDNVPIQPLIFTGLAPNTMAQVTPDYAEFYHVQTGPGFAVFMPFDPFFAPDVSGGFILTNVDAINGIIGWQNGSYGESILGPATSPTQCPPTARPEGEPDCYDGYVDNFNPGCNGLPPVFSSVSHGETICGTSGTFITGGNNTRDTDWFQIFVEVQSQLSMTVTSEFPALLIMESPGSLGCADAIAHDYAQADVNQPTTLSACVEPGVYWLVVTPTQFTGIPCGSRYVMNVNVGPCPPPPPIPSNDLCSDAILLQPLSGASVFGSTVSAALDVVPVCGPAATAPGVWFSVVGTGRPITASLCNDGTDYDSRLTVFCGSCGNLTCIGDDDDFCWPRSQMTWCSQDNRLYFILVHGYADMTGNFELRLTDGQIPCSNPIPCAGCDPAQGLVVALNPAHTHVVLNFAAPQTGFYDIYSTTFPNHDGDPNGGSDPQWTLGVSLNLPAGTASWEDPSAISLYRNYVVVSRCGAEEVARRGAPAVFQSKVSHLTRDHEQIGGER